MTRSAAKRSRARSVAALGTSRAIAATARDPAKLAALPDEALLEAVQRQTFRYFWEGAHPVSGLAFDRHTSGKRAEDKIDYPVALGGSGFGVMALIVAVERGWITREAGLTQAASYAYFPNKEALFREAVNADAAALIQYARERTDDTPIRLYLGGRAAALVKEQVCKGTLAFLRKEARKPGAYFWLKSAKRAKALQLETA